MDRNGDDTRDPRPLRGEPLGLDLLNTVWVDSGGRHDLLAERSGLSLWLAEHGFDDRVPATPAVREALLAARDAIAAHVADPDSPRAAAALNAVLAGGALRRSLRPDGPATTIAVDDPATLPGWAAAEDYLRLLSRDAARVRHCAGPGCVLHFYDTSKRGDRRWCSMAGCGNRAKAARHYARTKKGEATG
ncbi:CGNR zinc finger domain-containing protein [Pseudonocardia humida]|uniref:CGNR zinc finger domain-containing protein n=1 Tax=Pseudonocardia humida TaxID=2800819 RepID=A0ABT1A4Q2_9PSEU|nr:CGNR zinc finger domain-containing protein [Pseudonocardia humida]MCO1657984.1 CGNR zinc finger domain-containing protein [Pseudonocardia humida]